METLLRDTNFFNPATIEGAIVYAVAFSILAWALNRMLRLAIERALDRNSPLHVDRTRVKFLGQLAGIVVYIFAFISYAHVVPSLSGLGNAWLASVGVLSVIAGLAAQNTLGNLIAGISLLLYRPFNVGDRLQITAPTGLETGVVESLNLGYTLLKTDDNRHIVVPNNVMASQTTINLSRDNTQAICSLAVLITHDSDLDKARAILLELGKKHPKTQIVAGCPVTRLDGWGVELTLSIWCANSTTAGDMKCDLLEQTKKRFVLEGIKLPVFEKTAVIKP